MKKEQTFYEYLISKRINLKTAKQYENETNLFESWAIKNLLNPRETSYNELLSYVDYNKEKGCKARTINQKIAILRHYFDFHKTKINPVGELKLRGVIKLLPKTRLSSEELDRIYKEYKDYNLIGKRNKVMLGFVVYQGVNSLELSVLKLENIDLENGTIYIPKGHKSNSRLLELKAFQLLYIQNYILKTRPLLLEKTNKQTDQFFITIGNGRNLNGVISRIIKQIKKIEPKVENFQHLRASLITNWIDKLGLRKAQYFSGHRYVSSTERYEVNSLENLKDNIDSFHPF